MPEFNEDIELIDLLPSLGDWLNADLSFNPVPFNNLDNVVGLTSSDSLLIAIEQLDAAITELQIDSIFDLSDVEQSSDLEEAQILIYGTSNFYNLSIQEAVDQYVNINFADCADFLITGTLITNDLTIWNGSTFTNSRSYFTYSSTSSQSSYVVDHNLGKRYCMVEVINKSTQQKVSSNDYEITYNTVNQLQVVLDSSIIAHIIVFSIS